MPTKGTVLIGLSGGIDSSVAAWLLKKEGWNVISATMRIYDGRIPIPETKRSGCFGPKELYNIEAAKKAAERLDIPHYCINLADEYRQFVIDYFRNEYLAGHTPNPCVHCNQKMKFGFLQEYAAKQGLVFDKFATGHYARICLNTNNRYSILRGKDNTKDQSYFISYLTQKQLAKLIFPLGDFFKSEIKQIAKGLNWLDLIERQESQDFIACDNYSALFNQSDSKPGYFINKEGKILGKHKGIIYYTIGQRKGIGIGGGIPFYVININPQNNTITLGTKEDLYANSLTARDLNWVTLQACPDHPIHITAQIRQRHKAAPATLIKEDGDQVRVIFKSPQTAITPGQIVVFYDGDTVLGAGTIATADNV